MKSIDIHGVPVHIVEQEEIDEAVDKGVLTVVCLLVETTSLDYVVSGSKKAICGKCKRDVWLSPATEQSIGLAPIRCVECIMKGYVK
jgi:hypothetical protein